MKLTGDYSLFFYENPSPDANTVLQGRYSTVEIGKSTCGSSGGKPIKVFDLACKSVHGKFYDKRIGVVFRFLLRNNADGTTTKYEAGKRPLRLPLA